MRQFREAGHEVALMARRGSQMADTARSEGFQVYEQDGPAGQIKFLLGSGRKFDIIHAQTANTITWAALTRWAHHRPVVFSRRTDFRVHNDIKRSEEHTSELQSLMRISYAVFCLKKKNVQTKDKL